MAGTIGEVKSVHFEWLLDTIHGAGPLLDARPWSPFRV